MKRNALDRPVEPEFHFSSALFWCQLIYGMKEERLTGIASETKGTTRVRPLFALRYLKLNYCNVEGKEICTNLLCTYLLLQYL
jgi:hypothetical protein